MKRIVSVALLGILCQVQAVSGASLVERVTALESALNEVGRQLPPVGAVVAFALTSSEAQALAPWWLPADGRVVNDPMSPFNGRALPDMVARFPLGQPPDRDATDNSATTGGSRSFEQAVTLAGTTAGMQVSGCTQFFDEAKNHFPGGNAAVWDTPSPESACNHTHAISSSFDLKTELPLPPYRAVIYLVRVR
jgi:hypothetical protein